MPLVPGTRVGPYEILAPIGAGGMGEVYLARDGTLNRDVALKILPDAFAADPDRLARFRREAQVLASLNHPNIGHIYGFEDTLSTGSGQGGAVQALVLELIDGPTLADRIANGPIALGDALRIAKQLAEALEAAHERGIIHRDLKPANIKVRPDGTVKVLDFGLAKALDPASSSGAVALSSPTLTSPAMTGTGVILGTAAYMSPEQARGQAVDKRTDIWAFGCVLYEMLSGKAAFRGGTVSDTIAAILKSEPEWDALPAATPASLRVLLQRCLEKDLKRRLRDIGDAAIEIDHLDSKRGAIAATPAAHRWRPTYLAIGLAALTLLLLAAGIGLFYSARRSTPVTSPSEYIQITNFTDSATAPSLSADGRMVTFIRGGDAFLGRGEIYVKLLPNGESVQLTNGDDPKYGPVFTPDGSRVAYTLRPGGTAWETWTVPVPGGQPTRLLPNAAGLTWLNDRQVMFSEIKGTGLHMGVVTATESRTEQREIYFPAHERAMAHYSYASPDLQRVLVVEMGRTGAFDQPCRLVPFNGGTARQRNVGPPGACTSAAWSPDGTWMYFGLRDVGSVHLWRQKFPDGIPEQITFGPTEEEGLAMAPDGRSLITSIGMRQRAIWIHDATGERAISSEGYAFAPQLSGDGTRAFYRLQRDPNASAGELRSLDLASGKTDNVLPGLSVISYDISHDDREVVFTTRPPGEEPQIWLAPLDRRSPPRQVTKGGDQVSFGAGGQLVFLVLGEQTNALFRINKDGSGRERISGLPILDKFDVSPDGEWVVVLTSGAGEYETVAVPVHGGSPRRICSSMCAGVWSSDGRWYYASIDDDLTGVARGKTLAIPLPSGRSLPAFPVSGIDASAKGVAQLGAQVIEQGPLAPGPTPSTYLFTRTTVQRNLFRIPLH